MVTASSARSRPPQLGAQGAGTPQKLHGPSVCTAIPRLLQFISYCHHTSVAGAVDLAARDTVTDLLSRAYLSVLEHRPSNPLVHLAHYFRRLVVPHTRLSHAVQVLSLSRPGAPLFLDQVAHAFAILSSCGSTSVLGQEPTLPSGTLISLVHHLQQFGLAGAVPESVLRAGCQHPVPFPAFAELLTASMSSAEGCQNAASSSTALERCAIEAGADAAVSSDEELPSLLLPSMLMHGVVPSTLTEVPLEQIRASQASTAADSDRCSGYGSAEVPGKGLTDSKHDVQRSNLGIQQVLAGADREAYCVPGGHVPQRDGQPCSRDESWNDVDT